MLEYLAAIYRLTPVPSTMTPTFTPHSAQAAVDHSSGAAGSAQMDGGMQPFQGDDVVQSSQENGDNRNNDGGNNGGGNNGGAKVTTGALAEEMCVSPAAVSSMLRRLQDSGFVERSNADGITLTRQGVLAALQLIRRHRLLEVFLMEVMDFTWDQVDLEAHRLEHAISAEFEERIDRLCGRPNHCPHGDPIPNKDGEIVHEYFPSIVEMPRGQRVMLRRVGNKDARILRYLAQLQLVPGQIVALSDLAPFNGPVTLEILGKGGTVRPDGKYHRRNGAASGADSGHGQGHPVPSTQVLGRELAKELFVAPLEPTPDAIASVDLDAMDAQEKRAYLETHRLNGR